MTLSAQQKLKTAVRSLLKAQAKFQALAPEDDCTLCNNAQWWIDNGFTEAERRAFCASVGCPIPPATA